MLLNHVSYSRAKAFTRKKVGETSAAAPESVNPPQYDSRVGLKTQNEPSGEAGKANDTELTGEDEPAQQDKPVSPTCISTLIVEEKEDPSSEMPLEMTYVDVMVTGERHSAQETSSILTKNYSQK